MQAWEQGTFREVPLQSAPVSVSGGGWDSRAASADESVGLAVQHQGPVADVRVSGRCNASCCSKTQKSCSRLSVLGAVDVAVDLLDCCECVTCFERLRNKERLRG